VHHLELILSLVSPTFKVLRADCGRYALCRETAHHPKGWQRGKSLDENSFAPWQNRTLYAILRVVQSGFLRFLDLCHVEDICWPLLRLI